MIFTEKDFKKIARNLVFIRKAYGCETQLDFALALDKDARYPGLSYDMIKKYETGRYPITEKAVRLIASLTIFSFEDIVFGDLSGLEPNSLTFDVEVKDVFEDKDFLNEFSSMLNKLFPIFKSDSALKEKNFQKAIDICEKKLSTAQFNGENVDTAVNLFGECDSPEAFANIMSLAARLYVAYIYDGMSVSSVEKLKSRRYDNVFEFAKRLEYEKANNEEFIAKNKRIFLDGYNLALTKCMQNISKYDDFKDYVYYYLAARYYFGIMDNEITKFTDLEMNSFGINLMDCLQIIGNKYAKIFIETMKE